MNHLKIFLIFTSILPSLPQSIFNPLIDTPNPQNLRELATQLKTIVSYFNDENYEILVHQMRPRSNFCINFLTKNGVKVNQSEVENVVDLVNATLQAFPKEGLVYRKGWSIPNYLREHLNVLLVEEEEKRKNLPGSWKFSRKNIFKIDGVTHPLDYENSRGGKV